MATINKTESLSYWRQYFATANTSSIFDVLDYAITIAASDFSGEFSRQRNRLLHSFQSLDGGDRPSGPSLKEEKAEENAVKRVVTRIKIIKPKPCVDEVVVVDQAKPAKPTCVGEVKPMKPKVGLNEMDIEAKLEATKRKLHDQYEQIENSKRQKRVQVLNFVPKQEFKPTITTKPQRKKPGSNCVQSSVPRRVANRVAGFQSLKCPSRVTATH